MRKVPHPPTVAEIKVTYFVGNVLREHQPKNLRKIGIPDSSGKIYPKNDKMHRDDVPILV